MICLELNLLFNDPLSFFANTPFKLFYFLWNMLECMCNRTPNLVLHWISGSLFRLPHRTSNLCYISICLVLNLNPFSLTLLFNLHHKSQPLLDFFIYIKLKLSLSSPCHKTSKLSVLPVTKL